MLVVFQASGHQQESTIRFIENKNQWPANIIFKAPIQNGNLFLEKDRFTFAFQDAAKISRMVHGHTQDSIVQAHAYQVQFLGAAPFVEFSKSGRSQTYHNYFIGNDESKWAGNVGLYNEVTYHQLYAGIDLKAYSANGNFKYDFIVQPHADPGQIKMRYSGTSGLYLKKGKLHVLTSLNEIVEQEPYAYQLINGKKQEVNCVYSLENNELQFRVKGKYDKNYPLIIDPELRFATHSGSSAPVFGHTATYDKSGNTYSAGPVYDIGYPTTFGAFQRNFSGPRNTNIFFNPTDVAISKYNRDGSQLLFATYLGGRGNEYPHSMVVNSKNELLVFGTTNSNNFPVSANAYDRALNGFTDLFVTTFNQNGTSLQASTYVGGNSNDGQTAWALQFYYGDVYRGEIIVDADDNCYIASCTESPNFPVSTGAAQNRLRGGQDGVVFKLNENLSNLVWSTFIGGFADDAASALYLDSLNQVYVTGSTRSTDFPVTPNSLHTLFRGGTVDGFVTRISNNGSTFQRSTFLGTPGNDRGYFVQMDAFNNVYVLGGTNSNYPVSSNVYRHVNGSLFIHKLSAELNQTDWATTLGYPASNPRFEKPSETEGLSPTAFLVDTCGYIYVSGWGRTPGLPVTPDAVQRASRRDDLYLAVLAPEALKLEYATFFGGTSSANGDEEHVDGGTSRFDKSGVVHQAVCTNSHNFPTTSNAVFRTNRVLNNQYDKVTIRLEMKIKQVLANFSIAPTDSGEVPFRVNFTNRSTSPGTPTYTWIFGDGTTSTQANPSHTYTIPGTYAVTLIVNDPSICGGIDTLYQQLLAVPNDSTEIYNLEICKGDSALFPIPDSIQSASWSPPAGLSNPGITNPMASPEVSTQYISEQSFDEKGRRWTLVVNVKVFQPVSAAIISSQCGGNTSSDVSFSLSVRAQQLLWDFGDGNTGNSLSPTHTYTSEGEYLVKAEGLDMNGCPIAAEKRITVTAFMIPNIITPNNDQRNDVFEIRGFTPGQGSLQIFNRWGAKVFESGAEGYQNNWGGGVKDGTYFYLFKRDCSPVAIKGWVEVIR